MKISMKDYQHNEYDSGEYIINRDILAVRVASLPMNEIGYNVI